MNNHYTRRDGRHYQLEGTFAWWPVNVDRGKPWPEETPVLKPTNFALDWENPDARRIEEWVRGFPLDVSKQDKIDQAIQQAAREFSIRGYGGGYQLWRWGDNQTPQTLAKVWNRAMEILGYTEPVV